MVVMMIERRYNGDELENIDLSRDFREIQ